MPEARKCPECDAELSGDSPGGLCVRCALGGALAAGAKPSAAHAELPGATRDVAPLSEKPGDRIGRYKLLQKLGEGGMGSVWMAEQAKPVRRRVALKVITLGKDTKSVIARFEAERQALALMDHPNIARVLDGGATRAGRPYFVMELVNGIPLTRFCDEQRLSIRERLELFMPVCQAIQHAHQKGVIHRDIKPSNVLVALYDGRPVPKVIDFGIAKATGLRLTERTLFTEFGALIGTPEYMAPEQAEMNQLDIDTRSDIYSLGVLLYELLTGTTPLTREAGLRAAFDEFLRRIREEEPPRPSTRLSQCGNRLPTLSAQRKLQAAQVVKAVEGDLDWIVMKALEKDRARRYDTANALAADLQRHLHNEPVTACPPSKLYRLQKLVRRNKLVFGLGSAVAVSLATGLVALTILFFREKEASRTQTRLRQTAEAAEQNAVAHAGRAEAASTETKLTLAASDCSQAVRLIEEEHRSDALAYLVRSLSANPTNEAALTRLATLLADHSWHIPTSIFRHDHSVNSAQFSPDGQRLVTASSDRTARVWDAQSGLPLTEPLPHEHLVFAAQFSPDGRWIVTASGTSMAWAESTASGDIREALSGAARVWDARSGQPLTKPLQHTSDVNTAQFSPDGKRVVTASSDRTARIWDAQSGQPLTEPLPHPHWVRSAQFSPDGTRIVTATGDRWSPQSGTARVWDARSGQPLTEPMKHGGEVNSAQFSPNGIRIVTASLDHTARVWDGQSGQPVTEPLQHQAQVYSAEFSPDGKRVVTASGDSAARVWDAQSGQPLTEPLRHRGLLRSARFSPDGTRIVTASFDHTARVWDAQTGQPLTEPLKHARWVRTAQFSPDGKRILTACGDGTARVWDAHSAPPLAEPLRHLGALVSAQFSPDGKRIVTASTDSTARVWDAQTGKPLTEPLQHTNALESAQFSPDGKRIVTASRDTTARVWDAQTGQLRTETLHPTGVVHSAQFSPDGTRIVTASADTTARVWDAQTGQPLTGPLKHGAWVRSAQFSPDGQRIVTASGDSMARVWDAQTGQPLMEALKHERWVRSAQFSPDGKRIVTASSDNTARVWDAQTGQPLTESLKHNGIVRVAQFSPDGTRIVTASWDSTARVWDAQTGQPLTETLNHNGVVLSAEFSPDGKRIVTASRDSTARVWDAQSGQPLTEPLQHNAEVSSAEFDPDGKRIVTGSSDGTARVWDVVSAQSRCPDWLLQLAEAVSGQVLNKQGLLEETKLNRAEAIKQIRQKTSRELDVDELVVWGRWFLSDPAMRTISPYSKLTVPEYIENRIKENTPDSLAEAEELAFGNAALLARIAELRAAPRPSPGSVRTIPERSR
jgi:eukaryotic-like serine/threonine-protein kinase